MILNRENLNCIVVLFLFVLSAIGFSTTAYSADNGVHLISAEMPGGQFEKKDGKYVGAYVDFFTQASKLSGIPVDYRMVPWTRAVKETESSNNYLIFPFTRTEERESLFTWISPLNKDQMCFASTRTSVNNLEQARKLKRVLVWRGTSQQAYLEKQGFHNLVKVDDTDQIIRIIKATTDAAWYFICDQAQSFLDPNKSDINLKLGSVVAEEVIWLAGGKALKQTAELNKYVEAVKVLEKEKLLKRLLAEVAK